jgi:hypothetical protein
MWNSLDNNIRNVDTLSKFRSELKKIDETENHSVLFAENGVIVRNLNYRPWQWVYIYIYISFPVAKVFLAVFNKLIE